MLISIKCSHKKCFPFFFYFLNTLVLRDYKNGILRVISRSIDCFEFGILYHFNNKRITLFFIYYIESDPDLWRKSVNIMRSQLLRIDCLISFTNRHQLDNLHCSRAYTFTNSYFQGHLLLHRNTPDNVLYRRSNINNILVDKNKYFACYCFYFVLLFPDVHK